MPLIERSAIESLEKQYSHQEIANFCGVAVGSIARWKINHRIRAKHLQSLKEMGAKVETKEEDLSTEELVNQLVKRGYTVTLTKET